MRKSKTFHVMWKPIGFPVKVDQIKVIDCFAAAMTLSEAREHVFSRDRDPDRYGREHGEGFIWVVEANNETNTYRVGNYKRENVNV